MDERMIKSLYTTKFHLTLSHIELSIRKMPYLQRIILNIDKKE